MNIISNEERKHKSREVFESIDLLGYIKWALEGDKNLKIEIDRGVVGDLCLWCYDYEKQNGLYAIEDLEVKVEPDEIDEEIENKGRKHEMEMLEKLKKKYEGEPAC